MPASVKREPEEDDEWAGAEPGAKRAKREQTDGADNETAAGTHLVIAVDKSSSMLRADVKK